MAESAMKSRGQEAAEHHIAAVQSAGGPFVAAAEHTRMPMVFSDPNLPGNPIIYANESFLALTGYSRAEVLGRSYHFLMGAETEPDARAQIDAFFRSGFYEGCPEVRYYHKNGSSFWAIVFIGPVLNAEGHVEQHFVSFIDVTVRRREERRLRLLLNELNHRTQNTLATVQAIAAQTLGGAGDSGAVAEFENRILALSEAHRLLGVENWEGANLRVVTAAILEPFGLEERRAGRISISGEDILLPPKIALTLAMVFQELATNAVKYGALQNDAGHVEISWQVERSSRDERLRLTWQESGGPLVSPPTHSGFGSQLIEGGLAKELKGEVKFEYEPTGVVCQLFIPVPPAERSLEVKTNPPSERRVLLVEDEMIVAGMLRRMLTDLGYTVVGTATAVEEAIAMIHQSGIDAAVLDINLDGQMSYAVAEELTSRGIPFVFSTGYGGEGLPEGFKETQILKKPFRRSGLADALAGLLVENQPAV